ncbi:MAG TPA: hypothetical protein VED46_13285 [Alphaproteobacteria bacterium]|nr:hypothetical protein [Alphaproteobacteria bacterium]
MPKSLTLSAALIVAALAAVAAMPAFAVTSTTIIITDDGQPVPRTSLHVIDTGTGTEIPLGSGSNSDCGIVVDLPAGNYVAKVGSSTAGEFSVTGEGEKQVAVDIQGERQPDCKNKKRRKRSGRGTGNDRNDRNSGSNP